MLWRNIFYTWYSYNLCKEMQIRGEDKNSNLFGICDEEYGTQ